MFLPNPAEPLLSYSLSGADWHWGGKLSGQSADQAAEKIQYVWQQLADWLPEGLSAGVRSFSLLSDAEMAIEIDGLKRAQNVNRIAGMVIRLLPFKTAKEPQAAVIQKGSYRPLLQRGGWLNPDLSPAQVLHQAIERVSHSAVTSKEDANRAMRLSNISFERDGSDILMLATDGHRLTLHRLSGFSKLVTRMPKGEAIVPLGDLKALLPMLKSAQDVQIDLSGHEGQTHVYNYGFEGSYGPALVDAFNGAITIDGQRYDIPVVQTEFIKWRHVFPSPEWNVTVDSQELLSAISDLHRKWADAMKARPKRSSKKEPSGRLVFEKNRLAIDITPDIAGQTETYSVEMTTTGLSQNRPARFYMNFRYLRDALRLLDGPVVISGENDGTKSIDGNSYLVKPISLLDPSGPTEILIMPMHPPR